MSDAIMQEVYFFLGLLAAGVIVTVVYDVIRICRRIVPHGKIGVAVEDIVFWIISGTYIYYNIYHYNNGTLRIIAVIALLVGMCMYHYIISRYIVKYGYLLIGAPLKKIVHIVQLLIKGLKKIIKRVKMIL